MNDPQQTVAIAYDGLCLFEFGVATELFGLPRPELGIDWYTFRTISVDASPLTALGGVRFEADHDLDPLVDAGTIVIPGWKGPDVEPPPELLDALRSAHARGARIMTICSGVFVLAATGLLDGLEATTHWRYTDDLRARHPAITVVPDVLFVDNGQLLTSAGSAAGLDLGLHLIRRDHGADIANRVARRLVLPPQRDGGQAQFIARSIDERTAIETGIAQTLDWAVKRLAEPLEVADLAAHAAMSPRTFARRFAADTGTTPHRWLTRQRVIAAQTLLETTDKPIDRVATECGFGSAATLRRHFTAQVQTTPTAYRSRFRAAPVLA
jgi:AraC family transcriptional activator FtrA